MLAKHLMNSGASRVYVEDVFLANVRSGNGGTATITGGPDLATYGGSVHVKNRGAANSHQVLHSARSAFCASLQTDSTAAESGFSAGTFTPTSSGITLANNGANFNASSNTYVDWVYRNAPKFYTHSTKSHTNGVASTVDLSTLGVVGEVRVKRTDSTGSWLVWHRSLTAGKLLYGEQTAGETTDSSISVSGTTLTLSSALATGTYLVEALAHDTSADGLIQCGSFTTDGSGNATVTLGWEPQFLEAKMANGAQSWFVHDSMRGMPVSGAAQELYPNTSAAEGAGFTTRPNATGFTGTYSASSTYIYLAIRRGPMKPPTSGTQVYQAIARTGTGAAATVTGVGFPPDLVLTKRRDTVSNSAFSDRLRGNNRLLNSTGTSAETTSTNSLSSFDMDGMTLGSDADTNWLNASAATYINWCFRRYPGVFDQVCYTGTGAARTVAHNLGVPPELMIVKNRNSTQEWQVYAQSLGAGSALYLHLTNAANTSAGASAWNSTAPTASVFSVGGAGSPTNAAGNTYVAILFATLAGISKVFSTTKVSGSNKDVDCGFASGARFALLKRTDSTGDWYLWDSVRGIVAGNDPYLLLNSTAAEVTSTDYIDPYAAGFTIVDGGLPNGDYIGVAIS
jgi:hypothetical protein